MITRWIFVCTGTFVSSCFFFWSAFTFHHHRPLCGRGFTAVARSSFAGFAVESIFAYLELYQIRRIDTRITRRTELAFGITDRPAQRREGNVAERIGAEEFADFFRGV